MAQQTSTSTNSAWRRVFRLIGLFLVAGVACASLYHLSFDITNRSWNWPALGEQNDEHTHQEHAGRSMYLLGVGKADITGFALSF